MGEPCDRITFPAPCRMLLEGLGQRFHMVMNINTTGVIHFSFEVLRGALNRKKLEEDENTRTSKVLSNNN